MLKFDVRGIVVFCLVLAIVCCLSGFLVFLDSQGDKDLLAAYCILIAATVGIVLYNSIWTIGPAETVEVFLIGTHRATVANGSLRNNLNNGAQRNYDNLEIQTGLGGFDVVFALWPLWRVYRFSNTGGVILNHAGQIYTNSTQEKTHRVIMEADPNLNLRFLTIRWLITAINLDGSVRNLSESCSIHEGDKEHKYIDTQLSRILTENLEELVLEAVRKAASFFNWGGDNDIIVRKKLFELATLFELAEAGSILEQARVFVRHSAIADVENTDPDFLTELMTRKIDGRNLAPSDFYGPSLISGDFNIEKLRFARKEEGSSEVEIHLNDPLLGELKGENISNEADGEADSIRKKGQATADALLAKKTALGVDGATVLITDKLGNVNVTSGDPILTALQKVINPTP